MTIRVPGIEVLALVATVTGGLAAAIGPADAAKPSYNLKDVTACSGDAMRLCKDKLPDLEAIRDCMKENYDQLKPACQARFHR